MKIILFRVCVIHTLNTSIMWYPRLIRGVLGLVVPTQLPMDKVLSKHEDDEERCKDSLGGDPRAAPPQPEATQSGTCAASGRLPKGMPVWESQIYFRILDIGLLGALATFIFSFPHTFGSNHRPPLGQPACGLASIVVLQNRCRMTMSLKNCLRPFIASRAKVLEQ